MSTQYAIALDQGTTSTRAILFDARGDLICMHQLEFEQIHPHPDWTEHDPMEILRTAKVCIYQCVKQASTDLGITTDQIKALGITNQRETTVVWNRHTGLPYYNAIVWLDARTHSTCERLRAKYDSERIRHISGLPISTYFSGVKLRWMMDHVPEVAAAIEDGTAMFGTIDTWLLWNLSREKVHATDVTNAGRTMLMNINTLDWDDELLSVIGVTRDILPKIRSCSEVYGHLGDCLMDSELQGLPISGLIGDQQGALVGQSCFGVGQAKNTYGTGGFLIVNTGTTPKTSTHGLLTTPAYKLGDEKCVYSLEGSVAVAGLAVRWLRDALAIINTTNEVELLACSVEDTGDVYLVPAFSGLFAPWWREDARGTVVGMTQSTTKAHVARATLESIAFQVNAVLQAASKDMGEAEAISQLRVDGGASVNNLLMQMQADFTGTSVVRPKVTETTALGAAFVAGHAVGLFQSVEEFTQHWQLEQQFDPKISEAKREIRLKKWNRAVEKSLGWAIHTDDCVPVESGSNSSFLSKEILVSATVGIAIGSIVAAVVCRTMK